VIEPGQDGKPRAKSRHVIVGTVVGDDVLLIDGLKVGETVASSGSFKLRDGLLVVAKPDAQPK
jgi:membrane fusion protein (multidrug efflux system)